LIPPGVLGVITGFILYARERRRCDAPGCRMAGSRVTLAALLVASLIVGSAIVLDRFLEVISDVLAYLAGDAHSGGADSQPRNLAGRRGRWAGMNLPSLAGPTSSKSILRFRRTTGIERGFDLVEVGTRVTAAVASRALRRLAVAEVWAPLPA
jgi:hypothetical protein